MRRIGLLFVALGIPLVAYEWEAEERLTFSPGETRLGHNNSMHIVCEGERIFIVYGDEDASGWNVYLITSCDEGKTWEAPVLVGPRGRAPSIAVKEGRLFIAYEIPLGYSAGTIGFSYSPDTGNTWIKGIVTTDSLEYYFYPSILVTDSVIHITYAGAASNNIFYQKATEGPFEFSPRIKLNEVAMFATQDPSIAFHDGKIFVVWEDGRDYGWPYHEIYYAVSEDYGDTWSEYRLTFDPLLSRDPCVCSSGGIIHVVWHDTRNGNKEIFYTRSLDGGHSWETPIRLSTNDGYPSRFPAVAAEGERVFVVWMDERYGEPEVYYAYSEDGGETWSGEVPLTANDGYASQYPAVTIKNGVVHVAWEDYRNGNAEVYYIRTKAPVETVQAEFDLKPEVLNMRSRGKYITGFIELPLSYSPKDIDVATVRICVGGDSIPAYLSPLDIRDHDKDGIPELMVKFSRRAFIRKVHPGIVHVPVVGKLVSGEVFTGEDSIRVINPGLEPLVYPNPFVKDVTVFLKAESTASDEEGEDYVVEIYDALGRRIKKIKVYDSPYLKWDGKDRHGREVSPGRYLLRIIKGEETVSCDVIKL